MAISWRVVLHGAWLPDDPDGDVQDVQVYVDGDDLIFVVMVDGTGEVRISIEEFEQLVKEMDGLKGTEGKADG